MRVRIIRTTIAADHLVRLGQVVDLPEPEARMLIAIHKAELADDEPPAPVPLDTEQASPVIDTEAPKRRGPRRGPK